MTFTVETVFLRGILNSAGGVSVEAEVHLADGARGRGSVPVALAPGRREKPRSTIAALGRVDGGGPAAETLRHLRGRAFDDQRAFDAVLEESLEEVGADVALALSLAFCRAAARARATPLVGHLSALAGSQAGLPHPLANLFSGGIHAAGEAVPFQQIMIAPRLDTFAEDVEAVLAIYGDVEARLGARIEGYSAASGMLVEGVGWRDLLAEARAGIERSAFGAAVSLAVDVAAEHLRNADGTYRFGGDVVDGESLGATLREAVEAYGIAYVEDPFDADDAHLWRALTGALSGQAVVVGDDLFATEADRIEAGLAGGVLLKMNQAGTVSATLRAARRGRAAGMRLMLSHRSRETEDTAMCDLAVALGADSIKIGGPRRGDRIAKYNRLLRLAETYGTAAERRVA